MACDTLASILKGCNTSIGGIKKIEVTDFPLAGSPTYITIESPKEASQFTQSFTTDLATGASFNTETLTVVVPRRESAKTANIQVLAEGQRDLIVRITDNNSQVYSMGLTNGANLIKIDSNTGAKAGDANGYTLTFESKEAVII